MYAYFPSSDATTSCGSSPAGTRPITFSVLGSTIAIDLSFFSNTSKAGEEVWARTELATSKRRNPSDNAQTLLVISSPRKLRIRNASLTGAVQQQRQLWQLS